MFESTYAYFLQTFYLCFKHFEEMTACNDALLIEGLKPNIESDELRHGALTVMP